MIWTTQKCTSNLTGHPTFHLTRDGVPEWPFPWSMVVVVRRIQHYGHSTSLTLDFPVWGFMEKRRKNAKVKQKEEIRRWISYAAGLRNDPESSTYVRFSWSWISNVHRAVTESNSSSYDIYDGEHGLKKYLRKVTGALCLKICITLFNADCWKRPREYGFVFIKCSECLSVWMLWNPSDSIDKGL